VNDSNFGIRLLTPRLPTFSFRAGLSENQTRSARNIATELRRKISMKKLRLLSLAVAGVFLVSSTRAASFDDVEFWVGSGANRAAFVIDWNDGKSAESLLWGYRWDGTATGFDMFEAIVNADDRLFAHIGTYAWGTAIQGIGYDLNGSGNFSVSPALNFDAGGFADTTNPDDARVALDAGDHYLEGWDNGFWAYYTKTDTDAAWTSSFVGSKDRLLADGVWDGYSFALNFLSSDPSEPVAAVVPEPSTFALLSISALLVTCVRRKL